MAEHSQFLFSDRRSDCSHGTRIKICGITNVQDAKNAVSLGADAIGLIFHAPSARNLDCKRAYEIRDSLPNSVAAIAVVVDLDESMMSSILARVKPDYIQYHGSELPQQCDDVGVPYIKAIRVQSTEQIIDTVESYPNAKAILLDAYDKDRVGGTGKRFSWSLIPKTEVPIILAGGLRPDNVGRAIEEVRPFAVDVSTSVETSGGFKDAVAIKRFIRSVRDADQRQTHAL